MSSQVNVGSVIRARKRRSREAKLKEVQERRGKRKEGEKRSGIQDEKKLFCERTVNFLFLKEAVANFILFSIVNSLIGFIILK